MILVSRGKCKKPKFRVGEKVEVIASDDFPELIKNDPSLVGWVSYKDEGKDSMHALYKTTSKVKQIKESLNKKGNTVYAYFLDNGFWWNEHWLRRTNSSLTNFLNDIKSQ